VQQSGTLSTNAHGGEWNRYAYTTAGRDAPSRLNALAFCAKQKETPDFVRGGGHFIIDKKNKHYIVTIAAALRCRFVRKEKRWA